jgi:hypothetical protein
MTDVGLKVQGTHRDPMSGTMGGLVQWDRTQKSIGRKYHFGSQAPWAYAGMDADGKGNIS